MIQELFRMLNQSAVDIPTLPDIGKCFCNSSCVLFSTLSAGVESMEFQKIRTASHIHSGRVRNKHQFKIRDASLDRQPKVLSSQVRETLSRIMVQTNNDCRFQIFISTKFLTPATFGCWKIRFKTDVCTCSQFPMEAVHWIKEVEMVDSVDDLMSSSPVRGIQMPNLEVLDAMIASALNRIILISHFTRRISVEEEKGPEALPDPQAHPGHRCQ